MSIGVTITIEGLPTALDKLRALGGIEFDELLYALAKMGRDQTQHRIMSEKTGPDGKAWPLTTDGRPALFVTGNHMYRSIDFLVTANEAIWGSGAIGANRAPIAAIHQFGGTIVPKNANALHFMLGDKAVFAKKVTIPARPYLGVSAANAADMEAAAVKFIESYP